MILRPYQVQDIGEITWAFAAGARRVLYVLPTGGGKTVVVNRFLETMGGARGFVMHRRELIKQASRKLMVPHGIIAPWSKPSPENPIQLGSIQTMARRTFAPFDFVAVDEAHHAAADSWRGLLERFGDARILLVTATKAIQNVVSAIMCLILQ